ncbi:hypothetical protein PLANTIT3_60156 [Plantibacter sp. T3]|nr:hypothetical protein PLANTIT3_60156 [Plantibacter sp. T3]
MARPRPDPGDRLHLGRLAAVLTPLLHLHGTGCRDDDGDRHHLRPTERPPISDRRGDDRVSAADRRVATRTRREEWERLGGSGPHHRTRCHARRRRVLLPPVRSGRRRVDLDQSPHGVRIPGPVRRSRRPDAPHKRSGRRHPRRHVVDARRSRRAARAPRGGLGRHRPPVTGGDRCRGSEAARPTGLCGDRGLGRNAEHGHPLRTSVTPALGLNSPPANGYVFLRATSASTRPPARPMCARPTSQTNEPMQQTPAPPRDEWAERSARGHGDQRPNAMSEVAGCQFRLADDVRVPHPALRVRISDVEAVDTPTPTTDGRHGEATPTVQHIRQHSDSLRTRPGIRDAVELLWERLQSNELHGLEQRERTRPRRRVEASDVGSLFGARGQDEVRLEDLLRRQQAGPMRRSERSAAQRHEPAVHLGTDGPLDGTRASAPNADLVAQPGPKRRPEQELHEWRTTHVRVADGEHAR